MNKTPTGLGLYLMAMAESTIRVRVQKMADHGVSWVMIGGPCIDPSRVEMGKPAIVMMNPAARCQQIAEVLDYHGIVHGVWGRSAAGHEALFAQQLAECCTPTSLAALFDPGKIADIEGEQPNPTAGQFAAREAARALLRELAKYHFGRPIGLISPGPHQAPPTFPREVYTSWTAGQDRPVVGWHLPHLPEHDVDEADRELQAYRDLGAQVLIPSFNTFRCTDSGEVVRMSKSELDARVRALLSLRDKHGLSAIAGWSETQISKSGWEVLKVLARALADTRV